MCVTYIVFLLFSSSPPHLLSLCLHILVPRVMLREMKETERLGKGHGLDGVRVFGEELMNIVACLYNHHHVVAWQK